MILFIYLFIILKIRRLRNNYNYSIFMLNYYKILITSDYLYLYILYFFQILP